MNNTKEKKIKIIEKLKEFTFEKVVTIENLFICFNKCLKGTDWKGSVQRACENRLYHLNNIYELLCKGKAFLKLGKEFTHNERGKVRHVRSVHILERTVQKLLSDFLLYPILTKFLIKDNAASLKGGGTDFSRKRLIQHLIDFYRNNKTNKGYVLCIDFQKYFENIDHKILFDLLKEKILDKKLFSLIKQYISSFSDTGKGLCLGSQISQMLAIFYPNKLDHYIKEQLRVKGYGRYMDDSYLLFKTKEEARNALNLIKEFVKDKGLIIHPKKTQIKRIDKGFTFLKRRYFVTDTGKIIVKPNRDSIRRIKIKLKKLRKMAKNRQISYEDLIYTMISFRGHNKGVKFYYTKRNIDNIYNDTLEEIL